MNNQCPICQVCGIADHMELEKFEYGQGPSRVELTAWVKVFECAECGFRYTDQSAEVSRHAAVCQHLKVCSPGILVEERLKLGLTQEEMAEITGIGTASLSRWESGAVIQNRANDQLLYLIRFPENRKRLIDRARSNDLTTPSNKVVSINSSRFKFISDIDRVKSDAGIFQLRKMN